MRPAGGWALWVALTLGAGLAAVPVASRLTDLVSAGLGASAAAPSIAHPAVPPARIGLNLFGLATFNRQPVFSDMTAQSEWFSSFGSGWTAMPADQLDGTGSVRYLKAGQTAPRPLILPPAPFTATVVRCAFDGEGELTAGGVVRVREQGRGSLLLDLAPTGAADEGAWIELVRTNPDDPLRALDCREQGRPASERLHPEFLSFVGGFGVIRFLDWQRINDNAEVSWPSRATPGGGSQVTAAGASVEDMVDLANAIGADPWFLIPYKADDAYVRAFARLVHDRIDPRRTVYVELGNEVWNEIFDASWQARREGTAMGLGRGDPLDAAMLRHADRHVRAMRIWTEVFADRPGRLVRVCASQHANPRLATLMLERGDTAAFTDALATAPYIWLDLKGYGLGDADRVFAAMPKATDYAIALAEQNRDIARRFGKRYIAYEGGQHLVTPDLALARRIQRDPRMTGVYARYLEQWARRIGDVLVLYASTAPIADYGSWGLREYAGQPDSETPKLKAVRAFMAAAK